MPARFRWIKRVQIAILAVALAYLVTSIAGWPPGMGGATVLMLWAILLELIWQNKGGGA